MPVRVPIAPELLRAGPYELTGDDHHYLFRVRRLQPGAEVTLFDGAGREATATVRMIDATRATLAIGDVREQPPPRPRLVVFQALLKGERLDWCIEKLVELGVAEIVPVQTARCVVRLSEDRARRRLERWRAIADAAARQCRRAHAALVQPVHTLDAALGRARELPVAVVAWEGESQRSLADALPDRAAALGALIGPEGGFEASEITRIEAAGLVPVSLGPRVLRAETAAVAVAAIASFALGDTGG